MPIVALTVFASRSDMADCLNAGMDAFFAKPIEQHIPFDTLRIWILNRVMQEREEGASVANTHPFFDETRFKALLTRSMPQLCARFYPFERSRRKGLGALRKGNDMAMLSRRS